MQRSHSPIFSASVMVGAALLTCAGSPEATAASFLAEPLYSDIGRFETLIPRPDGMMDVSDVYYPKQVASLPITLLLQGALVDKAEYSNFAEQVAGYGFAVIVPNHVRVLIDPETGVAFPGLFPEQGQIGTTLDYLEMQNADPASPLYRRLDTDKFLLLGHSFGGAVGLASIAGDCLPFLCTDTYERPSELIGGAFYGARFSDPRLGDEIPPLANADIPVGILVGELDGVTQRPQVAETYAKLEDPPKALITVLGANHYGITNTDVKLPPPPIGSGDFRDPNRPQLEQAVATETVARWSALFLRATALGDQAAAPYVFETGAALDPNVTVVSERKSVPEPSIPAGLLLSGVFVAYWRRRDLRSQPE